MAVMEVEVTFKDKRGENDLLPLTFEAGTTDLEIRETVKKYVGRKFGDTGIKIDGKSFDM